MTSYRLLVSGKLNRFYTKSVYENAVLIGFKGYIKYLSDSTVECVVTVKNPLESYIQVISATFEKVGIKG